MDTDTAEKVLETLHIILVKDYSLLLSPYLGGSRDQTVALQHPPGMIPTQNASENWFFFS